jgi:nucleotide-binding universal stress UspA family protein
MYRCILAPVDGTAFGEHALPFAATLARKSGAVLSLVHVHEPVSSPASMETLAYRGAWNEIVLDQEAGYLEGLAERLARSHSIEVDTRIVEGEVAAALTRYARECGAELVVMATHGRSGLGRLLHHRVTEQLAREIGVPVLHVRPDHADDEPELSEERPLRRVLIPIHGTTGGGPMLDHLFEFGRLFRARFTLLSVVQPDFVMGGRLTRDPAELHHQLMRAQTGARQYLNALAERLRAGGLEVEALVRFAPDAATAIVALIESRPPAERFDMIVMEGQPHRVFAQLLSGTPHEQVARRSHLPVMVVQ